jgi:hypothetical protein
VSVASTVLVAGYFHWAYAGVVARRSASNAKVRVMGGLSSKVDKKLLCSDLGRRLPKAVTSETSVSTVQALEAA